MLLTNIVRHTIFDFWATWLDAPACWENPSSLHALPACAASAFYVSGTAPLRFDLCDRLLASPLSFGGLVNGPAVLPRRRLVVSTPHRLGFP